MPAATERKRDDAPTDEARSITASRVFDAPRELVWKSWTDSRHIGHWWGPDGFRTTTQKFEFKPGGEWRFVMHGPDGTDYKNHMVFREIVEPERITYSHVSGPLFDATATFAAEGRKTRVTVKMVFESAGLRDRVAKEFGAVEGLKQNLAHLGEYVAMLGQGDFIISRTFDAPRDLVWKAWTEEARLGKWFGSKGASIFHSKNDLRTGGVYHYGMRMADGKEIWGRWVYREIAKPERLVFLSMFSDANGGVTPHPWGMEWPLQTLSTITFADLGGDRTMVTVHWSPFTPTESERASFAANHASMNQGWSGTLEQFDEYLAKTI